MQFYLFKILLVSVQVLSDDVSVFHMDDFQKPNVDFTSRNLKYTYANHRNPYDGPENYRNADRRVFQKVPMIDHHKYSNFEFEDSNLDRIDFHYPNIETSGALESEFGIIVDKKPIDTKKYVFIQSQKVIDNTENNTRRPKFHTADYSNIQKITKTTDKSRIKYEEVDIKPNTKNRINTLLKNYLVKLYSQKYNTTISSKPKPTSYSKTEDVDPKTKNLDSSTLWNLKNKTINKFKKLFSLFTIVQFNHTQCNATNTAGTYQGICYTSSECTTSGGTVLGDCADGYGVCCVYAGTCGGSAAQNCSYFQSPNYPDYYPSDGTTAVPSTVAPSTSTTANPSPTPDPRLSYFFYTGRWARQNDDGLSCTFSVNKVNSNVSKMRIDFLDLELAGPTNGTCTDERLVISGQNTNNQVPDICGYNTGQHVYVDVSSLMGPLQLSVVATMSSRKRFRIRICQYEDSCLEPSSNCLQYYTGITGVISSFNYDQASMLSRSVPGYFNNLNYAICIRREAGYCSITYRNVVNSMEYPFQLINVDSDGNSILESGQAGADITNCPDDYIVIGNTRLCGEKFNDGTVVADFTMNSDVTDTGAGPIVVPVRTDSMVTGLGFKLFYTQNPCMTTF